MGVQLTSPPDVRGVGGDLGRMVREVAGAASSAGSWASARRRALLAEIDQAIAVLSTARGELLVAERDSGAWQGAGDRSFEAWRARTSRAGSRAAVAQVRQAESWGAMPAVKDAVGRGTATVEHLDALSRVTRTASPAVRRALTSEAAQTELAAVAEQVDAEVFARKVARLAARMDRSAHEQSHQAQRASRYLHLSDTPAGTRITGLVDRMAGHRLRLALEAVTSRPAVDDDRSSEQRRADALDTLAETTLALPETAPGAAVRPHVSFLMTAEAWAGLRRSVPAPASDPASGSAPASEQMTEPVTLEDGTVVPSSEVARALCDCELTRVVVDAASVPLDLGRTHRTYTGTQRRAVIARDRRCAWPSCEAHARWCEVHHIRWWDRDLGETSVENGVLLCSFHHHEVHRRDLTITRLGRPPGGRRRVELSASGHGPVDGLGLSQDDEQRVRYEFSMPDGTLVAPTASRATGLSPSPGAKAHVQCQRGLGG